MAEVSLKWPADDDARLTALVANPREDLEIEVENWLDLANYNHRATLAKAILAHANSGGGYVVIGFKERQDGTFEPNVDRPDTLAAYSQDAINGIAAAYATPSIHCRVHHVARHGDAGQRYPVIVVPGGHTTPIRARKGSPDQATLVKDRCYIRRPGPKSEEPQEGHEWDALFARCLQHRGDDQLSLWKRQALSLWKQVAGEGPPIGAGAVPPRIDRGFVCILRDGQPVGCGFFISERYVCTCAHVVAAALGEDSTLLEAPQALIELSFPRLQSGKHLRLRARVAEDGWRPLKSEAYLPGDGDQDIALLEIEGPLPSGARPLEVSRTAKAWGHPFAAYGYLEDEPSGAWAPGRLAAHDESGLLQLEGTIQSRIFAQPGFSGSPVWDCETGAVVGMVTLASRDPGVRIAFAVPIAMIERLRPGILIERKTAIDRLCQATPGAPHGYRDRLIDFLTFYLGSEDQPKPFGGRDDDIAFLNTWLGDAEGADRLLLTAPAGRGKSALLVHWAAQLPADCRVIFVPISLRFRTNPVAIVFHALAAQLAPLTEEGSLRPALADPVGYYMGKAYEYLAAVERSDRGPVVVILDGLDEGAGFAGYGGLFPARKLEGVKLIVSARLTANAPTADAWIRKLDWHPRGDQVVRCMVPPLSRAGLTDVLLRMGFPLADLAKDVDIVTALLRLTEGDPLLVGLYVEDLWSKGEQASRLRPEDLAALKPGFAGYFKKWFEDQERLWAGENPLSKRDTLAALAVLACALAPLRAEDIEHLLQFMAEPLETPVEGLIEPLHRFVIGRPDTDGYVLNHPKLSEFLQTADNGVVPLGMIKKAREGFFAWGRTALHHLEERAPTAEELPQYDYLLSNYSAHLMREKRPVAEFMALVENGWRRAWYVRERGYRGFAGDVARAFDAARTAAREAPRSRLKNEPIAFLAERLRCALCLSSIRTTATNIREELIKEALQAGVMTQRQALDVIELETSDYSRAKRIESIAPCLTGESLAVALAAARAIGDERDRANALAALAPQLSATHLTEALAAARSIGDEASRAKALASLAPNLSPGEQKAALEEALAAARAIGEEGDRASALMDVVPNLSATEHLMEALAAARAIGDEYARAHALAALASRLSGTEQSAVIEEALSAARAVGRGLNRAIVLDELARRHLLATHLNEALAVARSIGNGQSRASAFTWLARHLPATEQTAVVVEALAAARTIGEEWKRAEVLEDLAPHLSAEQLTEALTTARAMADHDRARTLEALAPHLSAEQLTEALAAARSIGDEVYRATALAAVAAHLSATEQTAVEEEALAVARAIGSEAGRCWALEMLAPHLSAERLTEALTTARAVGDEHVRARALAALAPYLSAREKKLAVEEALAAARLIGDEVWRTNAPTFLAPHMSATQLTEALAAARMMDDTLTRAQELAALLPHLLSTAEKAAVLEEALAAAEAIRHENNRYHAYRYLTPHLAEKTLTEALAEARSIGDECHRHFALVAHLSAAEQQAALEEALAEARSINEGWKRALALATLVPYLPPEQRTAVLDEALADAWSNDNAWNSALLPALLAPHLSEERLTKALAAARSISKELERTLALAALAPHLSKVQLTEALAAARATHQVWDRDKALSMLAALAPQLAEPQQREVINEITESIALVGRKDALLTLHNVAPIVRKLVGGKDMRRIANAIVDVGNWFP